MRAGSVSSAKSFDPRSLVRSDRHGPEWGPGLYFNHPPSRAQDLPPSRLLAAPPYPILENPKKKPQSHSRNPGNRNIATSQDRRVWGSDWTVQPADQGNAGLFNAIKAAIRDKNVEDDIFYIGTLGFPTDSLEESVKSSISDSLEADWDAITVYVNDTDWDGHYIHYCKTILWPVFHYQIPDHPKSKAYEDHSWKYYVTLNQAFADKIVKNYKRNDVIWIHDYHLLLVPQLVRKKLPDAKIGFFLHAAFPSSEVFRCLSVRKQLLEGMLGANLIAFQAFEYQEHFLTTCSRILLLEATEHGVQLEERFVNVIALPIGLDPHVIEAARDLDEVKQAIEEMKERYKGKRLIVARDKLDQVRGVRQKLLAFELFLNKYPQYKENVVLLQVGTTTTDNESLTDVITEIVTRINSAHSTLSHQPLVLLRQDIDMSTYLALLSAADIMLITSLREGMNLTCHEYILCQDGKQGGKRHGPLILSEFTGSSSIFEGNDLQVNPWAYQMTADVIERALNMSEEEKDRRYENLRNIITKHTGGAWVASLNERLKFYHAEQQKQDNTSIPRLSAAQLSKVYRTSQKRVFFLDYDGTLASLTKARNVHLATPQRALDTLNHILLDDRNIVYIMSGRTPDEMEHIFQRLPGVGIIAENGCFVRCYNTGKRIIFPDADKTEEWKKSVKSIVQYYHERIPGSTIDERCWGITFHYDAAEDTDGASRQAGECANHINDACASQQIHAVPGELCVVIEPVEWTKASAAKHVFEQLVEEDGGVKPDFLFVAGDDRADEGVFKWANELGKGGEGDGGGKAGAAVKNVMTVSLGKRNTEAMATLTQGTSGKFNGEFCHFLIH
jgi:trehalose 6-phosphate synthase complex regulatory subunit